MVDEMRGLQHWLTEPVAILVSSGAAVAILWKTGKNCIRWIVKSGLIVYQFPDYLSHIQHASSVARSNTEILLNRLSVATWESDETGAAMSINRTFTELTGWTIDDIRGNDWKRIIHPDDLAAVEEAWNRTINERIVFEMEYRWRTRWGTDIRGRGIARWQRNGKEYLSGAFDPIANAVTEIRNEIADMRHEQKALALRVQSMGTEVSSWFRAQREESGAAHTHMLTEIEKLRGDYERMKASGAK